METSGLAASTTSSSVSALRRDDLRGRPARARRPAAVPVAHDARPARCAQPPRTLITAELVGDRRAAPSTRRATAIAIATAALAGAFLAIRSSFDPTQRPDPADLRVRGGRHRRFRLAVGHAARRHRARRRADHRRPHRPGSTSLLAGHLVFLAVLASPRGTEPRGPRAADMTSDRDREWNAHRRALYAVVAARARATSRSPSSLLALVPYTFIDLGHRASSPSCSSWSSWPRCGTRSPATAA